MIPLVDDYLKEVITKNLNFLREHPEVIDLIFGKLSKRETLSKLKQFIAKNKLKVLIGFPREPSSLPCYVITLAGEQEQSLGLGDDEGTYELEDEDFESEENTESGETKPNPIKYLPLSAVGMNSTYRIECWSDNGDLTAYMFAILKFCLLAERIEMLKDDFLNISITAGDLEPVPDYFPTFVYRRALMISLMYSNVYFSIEDAINLDVSEETDIIQYIPHYYAENFEE